MFFFLIVTIILIYYCIYVSLLKRIIKCYFYCVKENQTIRDWYTDSINFPDYIKDYNSVKKLTVLEFFRKF